MGPDDFPADDGKLRRLPPPSDRTALTPHRGYGTGIALWAPEEPQEFSLNLADYWRLLMKHRILIGVIFVAALALGAVATLLMTPIYTAQTTLQIRDIAMDAVLSLKISSAMNGALQAESSCRSTRWDLSPS